MLTWRVETLEYVLDIIGFEFYILFDHVSIAFELSICWKNVPIDQDTFFPVGRD
jgi:hypothetical protein